MLQIYLSNSFLVSSLKMNFSYIKVIIKNKQKHPLIQLKKKSNKTCVPQNKWDTDLLGSTGAFLGQPELQDQLRTRALAYSTRANIREKKSNLLWQTVCILLWKQFMTQSTPACHSSWSRALTQASFIGQLLVITLCTSVDEFMLYTIDTTL